MALVKQQTITEFLMEGILSTWRQMNQAGLASLVFRKIDGKLFKKILCG